MEQVAFQFEVNITPRDLLNKRNKMDGLELMNKIADGTISACFFDPQYRGVLDYQNYGNEGVSRGKARCELPQMSEEIIIKFISEIERVLQPSGHLFLWVDKFHLCEGVKPWFKNLDLQIVDMLTWEKHRIGMGYRTRRKSEYLLIIQKKPIRVKDVWVLHDIPDVIMEQVKNDNHPHTKPVKLQERLIRAVTKAGDVILDPAMGSGSVLEACKNVGRDFIGGDING